MKGIKKTYTPMAEINVTPFVDIMLVLLIIFMVTAPMMQQGLEVDLPVAKGSGFTKDTPIVVSITKNEKIYINDKGKTTIGKLASELKETKGNEVLIKADSKVPYGFVIKVMARIKDAGIDKVGMITNPDEI